MTLIIPEGYAQFVVRQTSGNTDSGGAVFTFGMGEPLGAFPIGLEEAAANVALAISDQLLAFTDSSVTYVGVDCFNSEEGATWPMSLPGTGSTNMPPPNCSLLVKKLTTVRGARAKGRMFPYGFLDEGSMDEAGFINPTDLAGLQGAWTAFHDQIVEDNGCPVVILQNEEGVSPPLATPPVVSGFEVQAKGASQRRRNRR